MIKMTRVGEDVHLLVITNNFTQYGQAQVTSSPTTKCTPQGLWDQFVVKYGLPESIVSHQGWNVKKPHNRAVQVQKSVKIAY